MQSLYLHASCWLLILSACGPRSTPPPAPGPLSANLTRVDFGSVLIGAVKRIDVTLQREGGSVAVQDIKVGAPSFRVEGPIEQLPMGMAVLHLAFAPSEEGVVESTLRLTAETQTLELPLVGRGAERNIEITPEELDFGPVVVGSSRTLAITVTNHGDISETVTFLSEVQTSMFKILLPNATRGSFAIAPKTTVEVPVIFEPLFGSPAEFAGTVELRPCASCASVTVTLKGVGLDSSVSITPQGCLDFGIVNTGETAVGTVTVSNSGAVAFSILEASVSAGGDVFTLAPADLLPIDPNGQLVLNVSYTPLKTETNSGTLRLLTDDSRAPTVNMCLRGTGGGPDVQVTPISIPFGTTAVGSPRTRSIRVENRDVTLNPLQITDARIVIPPTSNTKPGEFSITANLPLSLPGGSSSTLAVVYDPVDAGADSAILELTTNDTDTPVVQIMLTGTGMMLGPCLLEVNPGAGTLDFGLVTPSQPSRMSFSVKNIGSDTCLFDPPTMGAGSSPAFSLVPGPVTGLTLAAGDRQLVEVEFNPGGVSATFTGTIEFNVNDPSNPHRVVIVKGSSGPGCLLIAPDTLDWASISVGCASSPRTVTVYDQCAQPVQVKSLSFTGNQSGSFRLGAAPSLPFSPRIGAPLRFEVQYVPSSVKTDLGGVLIETDERPEPYFVPLIGNAVTGSAVHEDTWTVEQKKVDVLFVIDNATTGSLIMNINSFVDAATQSGIDFHVAVVSNGSTTGSFSQATGKPAFVTPQTPNAAQVLTQNLNASPPGPATDELFETARLALDPARLASTNAGFLRNNANLLLIFVNDEPDSSPQSDAYYSAFFRGIHGFRAPTMLMVSAIAEIDPSSPFFGASYVQLANETGGAIESWGTLNWTTTMQNIASPAFGRRLRFPVTGTPANPQDITVLIDGQQVNATQGTIVQWSYSPTTSSIDFDPIVAPTTGSFLQIRYPAECLPP